MECAECGRTGRTGERAGDVCGTARRAGDLAIANKEKLSEFLEKSRKISADAAPVEAEESVLAYLKKAPHTAREKEELYKQKVELEKTLQENYQKNNVLKLG
jgi:hypothetical protein